MYTNKIVHEQIHNPLCYILEQSCWNYESMAQLQFNIPNSMTDNTRFPITTTIPISWKPTQFAHWQLLLTAAVFVTITNTQSTVHDMKEIIPQFW